MFTHIHPGAHEHGADHFHWVWLIALALTVLGIALASTLEQTIPRSAQVERGD